MQRLAVLALLLVPSSAEVSVFQQDMRLQRPLRIPAGKRSLKDLTSLIGEKTGREFLIHPGVPELRLFAASRAVNAAHALDELAPFLSDKTHQYRWLVGGGRSEPRYELIRRARDAGQEVKEAKHAFLQSLAKASSFDPLSASRRQITANDALPARYGLLKSLPASILAPAVERALRGERVVLPLRLFNRTTLHAAHGQTTVTTRHRTEKVPRVTFSWEEVDRGNGFVALEGGSEAGRPLGLRLRIGSGDPPPPGKGFDGPSSELIYGLPPARQKDLVPVKLTGEPTAVEAPAARVTVRARAPLDRGEDALSNALRQLSEGSHLLVLSRWSGSTPVVRERLPADIVDAPVAEAADRIAAHFKLACRAGKRSIWFKGPASPAKRAARSQ